MHRRNLILNEQQTLFHGKTELAPDVMALETPLNFLKYFCGEDFFQSIAEQTNLYSTQKNPNNRKHFSASDIKQFTGICYYMSIINMPSIRSFWSTEIGYDHVRNVMPINKFEDIKQFIHFNNNDDHLPRDNSNHDRLHKIRFIIDYLNEKPNKWGFKLFVIAGISGFSYQFEIYSGQEPPTINNEPHLGASSNIIVRLSRIIPNMHNYTLFYDNYYTSVKVMVHLSKRGILSLGAVRRDGIPNNPLPTDTDLKKENRGFSEEYVTTVDGLDISCTMIWKDNKNVTLLSSYVGNFLRVLSSDLIKRVGVK